MMRVRVASPTLGRWIWRYLGSTAARNYFISNATGTAGNMPKINGSTVRKILIPLPPADRLETCLERLERKLASVDRVGAQASRAAALIDRLSQATLAKAFRGELTPPEPGAS
jgi:type I restriction enzyme, S subunit